MCFLTIQRMNKNILIIQYIFILHFTQQCQNILITNILKDSVRYLAFQNRRKFQNLYIICKSGVHTMLNK